MWVTTVKNVLTPSLTSPQPAVAAQRPPAPGGGNIFFNKLFLTQQTHVQMISAKMICKSCAEHHPLYQTKRFHNSPDLVLSAGVVTSYPPPPCPSPPKGRRFPPTPGGTVTK